MSDRWSAGFLTSMYLTISYCRLMTYGTPEDGVRFCAACKKGSGGTHIFFAVRSGRRRVLLSPYTIPDVVTMVILGGEPVFFDFEPNSTSCEINLFDSLINDHTACAMITHYHVNEPRLAEITGLCRARGVFLFDDCAISFGGWMIDLWAFSLTAVKRR
jgi:dTDP-4-amino-4,6-dideoxygalactose transaminase